MVLLGDPIGIPFKLPCHGILWLLPSRGDTDRHSIFCSMGFDLISFDIICIYTNYTWKSIEDVISLDTGAYIINIGEMGISACFSQTTSLFVYRWLNTYIYIYDHHFKSKLDISIDPMVDHHCHILWCLFGRPIPDPSRMPVFWLRVTFETVPTWNDQSATRSCCSTWTPWKPCSIYQVPSIHQDVHVISFQTSWVPWCQHLQLDNMSPRHVRFKQEPNNSHGQPWALTWTMGDGCLQTPGGSQQGFVGEYVGCGYFHCRHSHLNTNDMFSLSIDNRT